MNLVLHQFRKDFCHFRWGVAFWLGLILIQVWFVARYGATERWIDCGNTFGVWLAMLAWTGSWIFTALFVPLLLHDEPMLGTDAFWFTRPVSWDTLLVSKAIFCCVILVTPAMVPIAIAFNLNPTTATAGPFASAFFHIEVILVVSVLGVLTRNSSQFLLAGLAVFIGYIALWFVATMSDGQLHWVCTDEMELRRTFILLVFSAATIIHQCATRRTARSIAIAAVGFLLHVGSSWSVTCG